MTILNKYKRWIPQLKLNYDKYWDFVLSQDYESNSIALDGKLNKNSLISYIDFSDKRCVSGKTATSQDFFWEDFINSGVTMNDIGFTAIDNGLISYDKSEITNEEFYKILTDSHLSLEDNDYHLHLNLVNGNTKVYDYSTEYNIEDGYYRFKGGFFQGFYKLKNFNYQILPNKIENTWGMEFVLRPRTDYIEKENTLNSTHENNKGIFFYMGTRAENKFAQFYNSNIDKYEKRDMSKYPSYSKEYMDGEYFKFDWEENNELDERRFQQLLLTVFLNNYFSLSDSDYQLIEERKNNAIRRVSNYLSEKEFSQEDLNIDKLSVVSSLGDDPTKRGYYEIETDNKYLIFDRTKNGFTVDTWPKETEEYKPYLLISGYKHNAQENLYLVLHRGASGKTVYDIEKEYSKGDTSLYEIEKDIKNNAFALKINEDGSIGYRYLIKDCENSSGYSIVEEYSYPNIIKNNEWNDVFVQYCILYGNPNECEKIQQNRKMKIFIYVNGYLKFISKELPEFNFKDLDEGYQKQECVPFNISLGGGTQGLMETIWLDYMKCFDRILPLEKYFGGTFIGDIKSFKFYNSKMQYNQIKNNYLYEKSQNNEQ